MATAPNACSCGGTTRHKPECAQHVGRHKKSRRRSGDGDLSKPCGYCRRPKTAHSPTCKRRIRTNSTDPIATIRDALVALEAELKGTRAIKAALETALGKGDAR